MIPKTSFIVDTDKKMGGSGAKNPIEKKMIFFITSSIVLKARLGIKNTFAIFLGQIWPILTVRNAAAVPVSSCIEIVSSENSSPHGEVSSENSSSYSENNIVFIMMVGD